VRLPVLDKFYDAITPYHNSLEGWGCVYVQHILKSNIACAEFLLRMGVKKRDIRIIGKAYSTNLQTLKEYRQSGFAAYSAGEKYDYMEPFDAAVIRKIGVEIRTLQAAGVCNLLVIDEGALAMRALSASDLTDSFKRIAIAELTARGAPYYKLFSAKAPIVDVARSYAKKTVEPPIIAWSMFSRLAVQLEKVGFDKSNCQIGVVGAGAIGGSLIEMLRKNGFRVVWFDRRIPGDVNSLSELASISDVLLSSTGEGMDWAGTVLDSGRSFVLANTGSSDIEFRLWTLRSITSKQPEIAFEVERANAPWREGVILQNSRDGRRSVFLSGGFPINFDGTADPIPAHKIQLTRTILMAGAVQAANVPDAGIHTLNPEWEKTIIESFGK
jgi:hypothetical protein